MALTKSEKTKRYRVAHPGLRSERDRLRYANRLEVAKRANKATKAWKLAHPREYKAWNDAWYAKNKEVHKTACNKRHLTKREKQAGRKKPKRCDVCKKPGKICFDHCHKSGKFRGWLCSHCNWALGHAKDNAKLLKKLADYIDSHKK
jgi:Recombination endonuclease VII